MKSVQKGFTLIELMIVVAIIGILAAVAIPQYQNYIASSQVSRVMSETSAVRTAVESCLLNGIDNVDDCALGWTHSNLLGQDGDPTSLNPGYDAQDGIEVTIGEDNTTIVATFGGNAAMALHGDQLQWLRNQDGVWVCSTDVDMRYRPASCQAELGSDDPTDNDQE